MGCRSSKLVVKDRPSSYARTHWLDPRYHDDKRTSIFKPDELRPVLKEPPQAVDRLVLNRVLGSMIGSAVGDALGASVEFRPYEYLVENPITDFTSGGTWGLQEGQFTDDTSMALCLAASLIVSHGFRPYDQLVRYKWWHRNGYMSSTGECFDIGNSTRESLILFEQRQRKFRKQTKIPDEYMDHITDENVLQHFDVFCGKHDAAGNGGLMRLAPVPLFFWKHPVQAVEYSGVSNQLTHGDQRATDACRYYGALIVAALSGEPKSALLDKNFYENHIKWFGDVPLHSDIREISQGSYHVQNGYNDGIRGTGFVVDSLRAALWAFRSDDNSFEKGVLAAINLGDDTDTTAAIYGQLAGAYYGYSNLPSKWTSRVYAKEFIECLSKWIVYEGDQWPQKQDKKSDILSIKSKL
ncbi:unnamed protein product [Adineta ricciae]|uniref:ADP-ribosylglycohydrolase n=1 Tax=Adineta ricciae TaxID=249248 RepID=A0A814Q0H6_ADIRI|nr:unnamed protein product [Adineta ricciae]